MLSVLGFYGTPNHEDTSIIRNQAHSTLLLFPFTTCIFYKMKLIMTVSIIFE